MAKNLLKRLIGEKNLGRLEYLLKPDLKNELGGPFNGQVQRKQIVLDLLTRIDFQAIVETGTFRGTTTAFLASWGLPVYTVEVNPRFYAYAALRLLCKRHRVHLYHGESQAFLWHLANDAGFRKQQMFFYLDAHWYSHVPLAEELHIIFSKWHKPVVMVDDFEVPGTDYGYDDYGPGQTLNKSYLEPLEYLGLSLFFPAIDASQETGKRRGCVVLVQDESLVDGVTTLVSARELLRRKELKDLRINHE
jgi:hypothetical protein